MKRLVSTLAALALASWAPAFAADVVPAHTSQENVLFGQVVSATANYTNATTSESDITGASITVPATPYIPTGQYYRACYWADAGKATATTGTIRLYVDGSAVAAADRLFNSAAVRGGMSNCFVGSRPTDGESFIVKLRGVSGDTNTFTVYNAQLSVEVFFAPAR